MTLTMIKLEPDMGRLIRWAEQRRLLAAREDDLGYALHALLAATFGTLAPKPFALVRAPNRPAALLGYAGVGAETLRDEAASFAEPDATTAIRIETLAGKAMPEHWEPSRRLGFTVRLRPMVRTDRDGDRDRTREVDSFVVSPPGSDRAAVYADWLRARLDGARIEQADLDAFQLSLVRRRGQADPEGRRPLANQRGPDATISGVLTVTDGDAFAGALARGIGRHRAFGFGMLLLRPVR